MSSSLYVPRMVLVGFVEQKGGSYEAVEGISGLDEGLKGE